jgi:GT2 family glycosyltransferase
MGGQLSASSRRTYDVGGMKPDEQTNLAAIIAEGARRLQQGLASVESGAYRRSGDGIPARRDSASSAASFHASVQEVAERMLDVEHALREDVRRRKRRSPRRYLSDVTGSRLLVMRQHPPVELTVPTRYLRTDPPADPPTISIVTPSHEQGRYLERTLHSVLSQNYPRLEYVVQDGASRDESREVLERYADRLTSWTSERDGGQADAINRGFARTSGEIMAFLNSDDLLLPGSLAYVARYFTKHPSVDVVYGHSLFIDEHDRLIGRKVLPRHDSRTLSLRYFIPQETLFWRRGAWDRAGGQIDPSFDFAIDWDFVLRLRDSGAKMARLPRYLGAFRVHPGQKSERAQLVGMAEADRLRRRTLGRPMTEEQALARVRPYARRHVLYHTIHRLAARLPLPRVHVRANPLAVALEQEHVSPFDGR